jgi:anti-sigma factor RsiW
MTCGEFRDRVFDFLDGTLSDRAGFEAHAAGCEACRALVAGFESNVRALAASRVPLAPPGLWAAIASRISEGRARPFRRTRIGAGLAAAAALVLSLGLYFSAPPRPRLDVVIQDAAPPTGRALRSLVPGYEDVDTATAMVDTMLR